MRRVSLDFIAAVACCAIVFVLAATGVVRQANNFLLETRFQWLSEAVETQSILVEIDTKSLQAMPNWPWDRSVYGDLVGALNADGATAIAFDIDFSAGGTAAGDAAFGDAIAAARAPVWLAAHRQPLSRDMPDIFAETLPNSIIAREASIASVTYPIDGDGVVRRGEMQAHYSFGPLPSIAAALAAVKTDASEYYVDFSIAEDSIRRISFVDVVAGDFPPGFFDGKTVFVGATALELGDEYVMPAHGMQSGVILNAIAFETLRQGRALSALNGLYVFVLAVVLCFLLCSERLRSLGVAYVVLNGGLATALVIGPIVAQAASGVIAPLAALHIAQATCLIYAVVRDLERRSLVAFKANVVARDTGAFLETLISENHDGFIVVDKNGVIDLVNDRAKELLSLPNDAAVGVNLAETAPDLAAQLDFDTDQCGLIGGFEMTVEASLEEAGQLIRRDLDIAVNRSVLAPVESRFERRKEPRVFIAITLHDISAQKRAEAAEREAKETHAQMSAAKTQLISNMSHELRTPLNSIIGFSDVLAKEMYGPLGSDEYKDYAGTINSSGRGLLSIVNDMLFATKLQAGELSIDPYKEEPQEMLDEAIAEAKKKPSWKAQSVDIDIAADDAMIRVDASTFKLALAHLIDNAAKFGGPEGRIAVTVGRVEGRIEIAVVDEGEGCDPALLPKLPELFYQGEGALSRNFEGAGLGLFLVDRIAALHGGRLALSSTPGAGFTARFIVDEAVSKKARVAA